MRMGIALLAVAGAACSSAAPTASPDTSGVAARYSADPVTVLVTNSTGLQLDVRAYLSLNPPIPQPLGGMLHLGSVAPGGSSCVQIPDSIFIAGTNVSTGQHEAIVWTWAEGVSVFGLDTTTITVHGQSAWFVPSNSLGWSVALANGAAQVQPDPGPACTP